MISSSNSVSLEDIVIKEPNISEVTVLHDESLLCIYSDESIIWDEITYPYVGYYYNGILANSNPQCVITLNLGLYVKNEQPFMNSLVTVIE